MPDTNNEKGHANNQFAYANRPFDNEDADLAPQNAC